MTNKKSSPWSSALAVISSIGPPVTVATALLVYFGWARSDAQAKMMGLDVSLFGYSVQDYVLRSVGTMFLPLVGIVLLFLLWLSADTLLCRTIRAGTHDVGIRRGAMIALIIGISGSVGGWVYAFAQPGRWVLFIAYSMAVGVLVAAWGLSLLRLLVKNTKETTPTRRALEKTLVFILVTLLLFWGTADYAQTVGHGMAINLEHNVESLPQAELFSTEKLAIDAPNVSEDKMDTVGGPIYRYRGFRLLVVSGGRFFLLHEGWTTQSGMVIVIPDNSKVRLEFGNNLPTAWPSPNPESPRPGLTGSGGSS